MIQAPDGEGPAASRAPAIGPLSPPPPERDRPAFFVWFTLLGGAVAFVIADGLGRFPVEHPGWIQLVAWCVFCAAANVLPVPAIRNISLSMGAPVNLAIALLFAPGLAATIVAAASTSEWELKRETTVVHALFNRMQLAGSTALAAFVLSGHRASVPPVPVLVAAVVVYQTSNWLFVALAEWTARGVPLRRVLAGLIPAGPMAAAIYLFLGFMGSVLALTSIRIGVWAVALLMFPLLGARHAVIVSRRLEQAEREQRRLADRLIDERERERMRIASDLHDVVLQQLAALQLSADSVGAALAHDRPDVAVRVAGQMRAGVDQTIADLRRTLADLQRASAHGGLTVAIERSCRAFSASTGIDVSVTANDLDDVPLPAALLVVECCQEALTNVAAHAEGSTVVEVDVARTGRLVELRVVDDGAGFEPDATGLGQDLATGVRSGLALSREKVVLSGGLLFVSSRPGYGTTVTVRVPIGERS